MTEIKHLEEDLDTAIDLLGVLSEKFEESENRNATLEKKVATQQAEIRKINLLVCDLQEKMREALKLNPITTIQQPPDEVWKSIERLETFN